MNEKTEMIIVAGANGVGKTTFAKPYTKTIGYKFLNVDEITKSLVVEGVENPQMKAGRIFIKEVANCLNRKENFVLETTLSGNYVMNVALKAKKLGYVVKMIYIFIDSEEACIDRVSLRVKKGGHHVPEVDIRRRFKRSLHNFWDKFTNITDWVLFYNGLGDYQKTASGREEKYTIQNKKLFEYFEILKNK